MRFTDWKPLYMEILSDFGFDPRADEEAARRLDKMLGDASPALALLGNMVGGKVTVVGPAATCDELRHINGVVLVADSAVSALAGSHLKPLAIVTDLDGDLDEISRLSAEGSVVVVHAHGDNVERLVVVRGFAGTILGTCQCEPVGSLRNFGGFTDGDRASFLAEAFCASSVDLVGFDFDNPAPKPGADPAVKRRKLAWARRLLRLVKIPVTIGGKPLV
jgi:hypothetical protein